ncbi:MAG: beta-galactosidase, partial [Ancrocorticia sp.]
PVRTLAPEFMVPASNYLRRVYDIVAPFQISRGGPVILVQIENEYGAYGNDHAYLRSLTDLTRQCGIDVPLTTVDQPAGTMLEDGSLPDLLATGSFGSRAKERLAKLRDVQRTGPLMCSEFWDGWFDSWGQYHHTTLSSACELADLLEAGASVNLYMFHGGTNFGLTNGANDKGQYRAITTSYDYDAPLDETGHPTAKYWEFREVLSRFTDLPDEVPSERPVAPVHAGTFTGALALSAIADQLGEFRPSGGALTMDSVGQYRGFARYRRIFDDDEFRPSAGPHILRIGEIRDRAIVEVDGRRIGVLERMDHDQVLTFDGSPSRIEILVEDMGRVNYGPRIGEHKGIVGSVSIDGTDVPDWEIAPLDIENLMPVGEALRQAVVVENNEVTVTAPTFLRAHVTIDGPTDLFLDTQGWGHGLAWINGHLLGRYSRRGPQRTLYVPAPYLRAGENELLVFETDPAEGLSWATLAGPDLGPVDW